MTEIPTPAIEAFNPQSRQETLRNRALTNRLRITLAGAEKVVAQFSYKEAIFTDIANPLHEISLQQVYPEATGTALEKIRPEGFQYSTCIFSFEDLDYDQSSAFEKMSGISIYKSKTFPTHSIGADEKPYALCNTFLFNDLGQAVRIEFFVEEDQTATPESKTPLTKLDFVPIKMDLNYARVTDADRKMIDDRLRGISTRKFVEIYAMNH